MFFLPISIQKQATKNNRPTKYGLALLIGMSLSATGQEVDISAALDTSGYVYETQFGNSEEAQSQALTIKPSISGNYSSRRLSASLTANHTRVNQYGDSDNIDGSDDNSTNQNYTDLRYTSSLSLIENALSLTLNGSQSYRNINQQQDLSSDRILASEGLIKNRNNSAQLNFSIPNPIYLGFALQSNYSKTQTEQSQESALGIDSDNLGVSARLYQGKNIRNFSFDVSAQYNDTSRASFQRFKSTRAQANVGFPIIRNIDFLIIGSLEDYDTGQTEFANRPNVDTTSYGAGLRWRPSDERILSLTYNQLDEGDNQTEFWGVNLAWALSSRTALNFDYGKRFYGDAYGLEFKHSLKSLRTSVSYSEDVTSFSRLNTFGSDTIGIFVCEFGSSELTDCFQPDSLDYQLQVGEEFRAFTGIETDISEEVIFRKSGRASIGYDKRRVKISIDATYSRTEFLESDRLSTNRTLRFNFNYALGRKTDISFISTVAKNQFSELEDADTILTSSINFTRDLTAKLKLDLGFRLLDRKSNTLERDGSDKRLTVGLNYRF